MGWLGLVEFDVDRPRSRATTDGHSANATRKTKNQAFARHKRRFFRSDEGENYDGRAPWAWARRAPPLAVAQRALISSFGVLRGELLRARAHKGPMADTRTEPESEQVVWRHLLVAKYTGAVGGGNTAIAHGVYVARVERKHRTRLNNNDASVELRWLGQVSGHASPHHHAELSHMWRVLAQNRSTKSAQLRAMYQRVIKRTRRLSAGFSSQRVRC